MFLYNETDLNLSAFVKRRETDTIYWTKHMDSFGTKLFSFDKVHVYNLYSDWNELTNEQKDIFRKEFPRLVKLVGE